MKNKLDKPIIGRKILAIYLRLSKEDLNSGESDSISNQRDLLTNFIKTHDELKEYEQLEFVDDGISGATFDRPALNKLLNLAGKTIKVILVKDLSRFGRNLIKVGDYIDQIFPELGVRFISVNDGYDSNDLRGRTAGLDVGLKAFINEMYSRDCSNKIKASKRMKLKNGEYIGGLPFYGYMKSPTEKNKLIKNPDTAPIVSLIFKLANNGNTAMEITKKLNSDEVLSPRMYLKSQGLDKIRGTKAVKENEGIWIISTVRRILYDERYTGVQISGKTERVAISSKKIRKIPPEKWIITENAHEAIVTKEEWKKAGNIFRKRVRKSKAKDNDRNVFKEIVKCGDCSRTLSLFKDQKQPCYRCNTHKFIKEAKCSNTRLNEAVLKELVLDNLHKQIQLFKDNKSESSLENHIQKDILTAEQKINRLQTEKTSLFESLADEKITREEFQNETTKISQEISKFKTTKHKLLHSLNDLEISKKSNNIDLGRYSEVSELSAELVRLLINKIIVYDSTKIEIFWNFKTP